MMTNNKANLQNPDPERLRFVVQWLRLRWPVALLLVLMFVVFALVTLLYAAPLAPLLYAGQICLALLLLLGVWDFFRIREKHKSLVAIKKTLPESLALLPEYNHLLYQDMGTLLHHMTATYQQAQSLEDARYRHLKDYVLRFSHQVKTPLAAARLLLTRQQAKDSPALLTELDKIARQVDMMLNFFKLQAGADDLLLGPHALLPLVQQAVRSQARVFIEKRLTISLDIPEKTSLVTDSKLLVFVLEQLLSNAAKYTQKGGVRIAWLPASHMMQITDTGPGIPMQDLPRVMEQGYTGSMGHRHHLATGMGLYLAKLGAERLGAALAITASPGEGTTASLVFAPQAVPLD